MRLKQILLISFVLGLSFTLSGQEKLEREYRIRKNKVPAKAIHFVKSMQLKSTIKWYAEESLTGKSIEAKTTFKKIKYSIEFDTLGNLQDIEILIEKRQIPQHTWKTIDQELTSYFKKYKVVKIQKQLSGNSEQVLSAFLKNDFSNITIKYELIIKGKVKKKKHLFEYTFSDSGAFEKREKIVFRNSDNLEY